MRDFFHGWRRKVGCVLLVVTCALAALWVRSLTVCDAIEFDFSDAQHTLFSCRGRGHWLRRDNCSGPSPRVWSEADLELAQARFAIKSLKLNRLPDPVEFRVGYCAIVMPLTLISAILILWPKRKQPSGGDKSSA
ncbi:MAG: hypothetical protein JWP89_2760 [Schlesneria sp.]|nr:hypothetical protein [Schlesneria sp.]